MRQSAIISAHRWLFSTVCCFAVVAISAVCMQHMITGVLLQVVAVQEARMLYPDLPIDCVVSLGVGVAPEAPRSKTMSSYFEAGAAVVESATGVSRVHEALARHARSRWQRLRAVRTRLRSCSAPLLHAVSLRCSQCRGSVTIWWRFVCACADSVLWTNAAASAWTAPTKRRSTGCWLLQANTLHRRATA